MQIKVLDRVLVHIMTLGVLPQNLVLDIDIDNDQAFVKPVSGMGLWVGGKGHKPSLGRSSPCRVSAAPDTLPVLQ